MMDMDALILSDHCSVRFTYVTLPGCVLPDADAPSKHPMKENIKADATHVEKIGLSYGLSSNQSPTGCW
jgi:hypothetical protein